MRSLTYKMLVVSAAIATAIGVRYFVQVRSPLLAAANGPSIEVDSRSLDFGTQWAKKDFKWRILVHNPSHNSVVRVSRSYASCACTGVRPSAFTLRPGEAREVELTIDLIPGQRPAVAHSQRFLVDVSLVVSEPREHTVTFQITGEVRFDLVVTPSQIDFGRIMANDAHVPEFIERAIDVTCSSGLDQMMLVSRSRFISIAELHGVAPGPDCRRFAVRLHSLPALPLGQIQEFIEIHWSAKANGVPSVAIPIIARVVADVQAEPDVVVFSRPADVSKSIRLTTRSSATLRIIGVECEPQCVTATLADGGSADDLERYIVVSLIGDTNDAPRSRTGAVRVMLVTNRDPKPVQLTIPVYW